jgi:hypothetical protein
VATPLAWVQDGIAKHHPTRENAMTTKEKVARRKLSLLELAQELDNVSRACRVMGYSRQQFYEIRRNSARVWPTLRAEQFGERFASIISKWTPPKTWARQG